MTSRLTNRVARSTETADLGALNLNVLLRALNLNVLLGALNSNVLQ